MRLPHMANRNCLAVVVLTSVLGTAAAESPLTSLKVYPPDINLETARDRQSFVAQAWFANGLSRDVTAEATVTLANPSLVKRDGNVLYPVADGSTEMAVAWGGKSVKLPIKVKDAKADRPISFKLDVMPIFMRPAAMSAHATERLAARMAFACRSSVSIPMAITIGSPTRSAAGTSIWRCPRRVS